MGYLGLLEKQKIQSPLYGLAQINGWVRKMLKIWRGL